MLAIRNRIGHILLALALALTAFAPVSNIAQAQSTTSLSWTTGVKSDIPTIDPALVSDTTSNQVASETNATLVRPNEEDLAKIDPDEAVDLPKTSSDGLTLTFSLRKDVFWVQWDVASKSVVEFKDASGNPVPVTAKDFEYGIKRTLDPRTASTYAYVFNSLIVGANDFNSYKPPAPAGGTPDPAATPDAAALQKLSDAVGVKAIDDYTLEIKLTQPYAFTLGILGLPNAAAQPKVAIDKYGDKWTEPGNALSYGPYVVSEWKHDSSLTMTKNPFWPGTVNSPKASVDTIVLPFLESTPSFNNYQQGKLDVIQNAVPIDQLDRIRANATLGKELKILPNYCTYYYGFNTTKAPFDDARVRRAFSYAIDRESLVKNVTKGGEEPAFWMGHPGLAAGPTLENSPELGIKYDAAQAKKELQSYLDEKKITVDKLPSISLLLNNTEAHVKIATAIQQMWQKTLGVKVQVSAQEWKVFLNTLSNDPPQVFRSGWCKDYADENNFTRDIFNSASGQNNEKYTSKDFDKLTDDAAVLADPAKRLTLYQQAEELLVKTDAAIAPIYWYTSVALTKPYIKRTYSLGQGDDRFEKWSVSSH